MKKADKYLGGQSGEAAKALRTRKQRLDEAIDGPKKSPNQETTEDSSKGRPKQNKKWYE